MARALDELRFGQARTLNLRESLPTAREAGFLVNAPAPDVIRLAPPLVLRDEQVSAFVAAVPGVLDAVRVRA